MNGGQESVTDIAVKTGYTRPDHLFRTFRAHFGMSPRQFREQAAAVRNLD